MVYGGLYCYASVDVRYDKKNGMSHARFGEIDTFMLYPTTHIVIQWKMVILMLQSWIFSVF